MIYEKEKVVERHVRPYAICTYLDRLYALLDVDDLRWVRNIPVHVLAHDAGSSRNELNFKNKS